jgi:hypothetical protein
MDPYLRAEQFYQDIVNSRAYSNNKQAIDYAVPIRNDTKLQRVEHLVVDQIGAGHVLGVNLYQRNPFAAKT